MSADRKHADEDTNMDKGTLGDRNRRDSQSICIRLYLILDIPVSLNEVN